MTRFSGEIAVSPTQARRRANGYLAREVALFFSPSTQGKPFGGVVTFREAARAAFVL